MRRGHLHFVGLFSSRFQPKRGRVPLQFSAMRINLYNKRKRNGGEERKKKGGKSPSWSRCSWIEIFPARRCQQERYAGFRLIDKTVAAGCNSFPYHWPSSRSGYRGRCTLRARSSFHRLRSSRIERWRSSATGLVSGAKTSRVHASVVTENDVHRSTRLFGVLPAVQARPRLTCYVNLLHLGYGCSR